MKAGTEINLMNVVPVESGDGSFFFRHNGTLVPLLTAGGTPLPLLPGWTPSRILIVSARVSIMQLPHLDGNFSLWFLDENFRYGVNEFRSLQQDIQDTIKAFIPHFPNIPWESEDEPLSFVSSALARITFRGVRLFNGHTSAQLEELSEFWQLNE